MRAALNTFLESLWPWYWTYWSSTSCRPTQRGRGDRGPVTPLLTATHQPTTGDRAQNHHIDGNAFGEW